MTTDHHLSPEDAAVAVRSFPRRFRALLARPDDEDRWDPDEIGRRIGSSGSSAADHLLAADGVLALVDRALEQVRSDPDAALHPSLADLGSATWDDPHTPVPALLDQLQATAEQTASRIESVPNDAWAAPARIAGVDATSGLLDLVREAVGVTAGHLRSAERVIAEVK